MYQYQENRHFKKQTSQGMLVTILFANQALPINLDDEYYKSA